MQTTVFGVDALRSHFPTIIEETISYRNDRIVANLIGARYVDLHHFLLETSYLDSIEVVKTAFLSLLRPRLRFGLEFRFRLRLGRCRIMPPFPFTRVGNHMVDDLIERKWRTD